MSGRKEIYMKKETVIADYFSNNNGLIDRLGIKSKIISRLIIFILCSIIYPIIAFTGKRNIIIGDEIETMNAIKYIDIIMIVCYIIAGFGLIFLIMEVIFPKQISKITSNLTYKVKLVIFNVLDWGIILPICIIIAIFLYSYIFVITPIKGTSMNPTIENGENVLVSYLDKVDQFDVIVLRVTPEDNFDVYENNYYIKRVIGLPGQTVTWIDKVLTIDGKVVEESFFPDNYLSSIRGYTNFNGSFSYKKDGNIQNNVMVIPEGYYFVMGDNRNDIKDSNNNTISYGSKDSRLIGLIPEKNIVGVAKYHLKGLIPVGKIA